MGQPLSFFGPTQGIVQPSGLVSYRKAGAGFILDPDVTVGWKFAEDRNLIDRKNGLELDFTRASEGTFFDASGNRQTALNDVARFDHDRITRVSLGLLIEDAATNEFLNSDVPATQDVTTTAQDYTVSMYGTGSVTLSGTATGVATDGSPLTVTASAGTLTLAVAGGPDEVQLEAAPFASSFIKTGGVSVTRANDNCFTMDVSWYNNAASTAYCQSSREFVGFANPQVWEISDLVVQNRFWVVYNNGNILRSRVTSSLGSSGSVLGVSTSTDGQINKSAVAHAFNDMAISVDGTTIVTDADVNLLVDVAVLNIGRASSATSYLGGHVAEYAYANVRKDDAFLQSITQP